MKKYIVLFVLLLASSGWCQKGVTISGASLSGAGVVAAASYVYDLKCEDNAASTTVTNDGTGADATAGNNTSVIHSADAYAGSGAFDLFPAATNYNVYTPNWTSEKFEIVWAMKLKDDTPADHEWYVHIGDGDSSVESNEVHLYRLTSAATQVKLAMKGNGGTTATWTSTNFTNDMNYHVYTLTIDASGTTWTATLKQDSTTITWDSSTGPDTAAVFNAPIYFGKGGAYIGKIVIDSITIKDNS